MDIETIKNYEEELRAIGKKQTKCSAEYMRSRREYATLHYSIQFAIARVITEYRQQKSNVGIDMAIQMKIRDAQDTKDQAFLDNYKKYLIAEAEYKSYEKALEALQSEAIGIQAIMKYLVYGERFSNDKE